jgi:hypothetical protein
VSAIDAQWCGELAGIRRGQRVPAAKDVVGIDLGALFPLGPSFSTASAMSSFVKFCWPIACAVLTLYPARTAGLCRVRIDEIFREEARLFGAHRRGLFDEGVRYLV